jgi:hypothetical protein
MVQGGLIPQWKVSCRRTNLAAGEIKHMSCDIFQPPEDPSAPSGMGV